MLDAKSLLNDLLNSNVPGTQGTVKEKAGQVGQMAKDNPLATGAIAAVLLGTGMGRALTGSALRLGGAAAVAGLAYKAYQNYQQGKSPTETAAGEPEILPPPAQSGFEIDAAPQGADEFAATLVKAMISASRADGHIDDAERGRIADRLAMAGLHEDAQTFIRAEIAKPVDMDALVNAAKTDAQKVELYTASRLAIEPKSRAERGYLDMLAGRLALPDALVDHIEATVSNAKA